MPFFLVSVPDTEAEGAGSRSVSSIAGGVFASCAPITHGPDRCVAVDDDEAFFFELARGVAGPFFGGIVAVVVVYFAARYSWWWRSGRG